MTSTIRVNDSIGGKWRIQARLGEGATGEVFRAVPLDGTAAVAVKIVHAGAIASAETRKRFEREAHALAGLSHENVVGVIEIGEHSVPGGPTRPYLVMELLTGASLESLLVRKRLEPGSALALGREMLAGLAHAHALGLVHRDVKPGNLVVTMSGATPHLRLVDFGLVRFADTSTWGQHSVLTAKGAMVGTPAYMSPEHAFGPVVDARSDVYSAGVVLFEMLTGSWPFVAEEVADVLRAHALDPVPALASARADLAVAPELDALVARAMAKRPDDRFADAGAMLAALDALPERAAWLTETSA